MEIIWRITGGMERVERYGLRHAMLLPAIFVRAAEQKWLAAWPSDPLGWFLRLRTDVWLVLALSMFMLAVFLILKPLPLPTRWHFILLLVLLAAHALISPLLRVTHLDWMREQAVYRTIATACCLGWILLTIGPSTAPAPREFRRSPF